MGLRQTLNEKKSITTIAAIVFVLAAAWFTWSELKPPAIPNGEQSYYTDDDGATFFIDSNFRVPPFDHNGKTAVRAQRYTYDGGSKNWCQNLDEYPPDIAKRLNDAVADADKQGKPLSSLKPEFLDPGVTGSMLVKRPLSNDKWVPAGSKEGTAICVPTPPEDTRDFDMMFPP